LRRSPTEPFWLLEASYEKSTTETYHLDGYIEVESDGSTVTYADIAAHYDIGIIVGRRCGAPHRKPYVPCLRAVMNFWSIDKLHKAQAFRHAAKALSLTTNDASFPTMGSPVTTHLILLCVEVELCTYENLHCYLTCMKSLVLSAKHRLESSDSGKEIMHGFEYPRAVLRFVAGPWSECDV
jgi:hypothetical protein